MAHIRNTPTPFFQSQTLLTPGVAILFTEKWQWRKTLAVQQAKAARISGNCLEGRLGYGCGGAGGVSLLPTLTQSIGRLDDAENAALSPATNTLALVRWCLGWTLAPGNGPGARYLGWVLSGQTLSSRTRALSQCPVSLSVCWSRSLARYPASR